MKISSSNVANFQLGIDIGIGNIFTLATFTSVGVGERNWRFENLVRNTVVCLTQSTLSSQSNPKTTSHTWRTSRESIGNWYWYWQHFHTGNIYKCLSWRAELELESGIFGDNRNKRSARGADPTAARTPLATRLSRSLGLSRYNRAAFRDRAIAPKFRNSLTHY